MSETLGHYEILGPIGAGGMGEVYSARDPILGRKVAIKMLPLRLSGDRDTLTRFTQEARSASALNHPNIVTIHEVGSSNGTPYIVMEFIDGKDLRSMISLSQTNAQTPIRKVLDVAAQIADGLAAAHERGIVHRDLKPENVMLTRDGFVKILDFGLAKLVAPTEEDKANTLQLDTPGTNPGTILGTVGYMSPEQATGRRLDFRSDQFALGAILYELTTGKAAFSGDNAIDILSAILHEEPEPMTRTNPRVPIQFNDIVKRLLSKEPDERYASTRDLARELRLLRDRVAAEESGFHTGGMPVQEVPASRAPAVIAAAALAIAILGAIWMAQNRVAEPPRTSTAPVAQSASADRKYLAVLRFKDLSGDPNGQLVVDGFAETLSARLARFSSVQVMRPAKPDTADAPLENVARELGANLVLTGSMQRSGDRLRISYSIFDVDAKRERSGDVIDGSLDNLFSMQDRLADNVASVLQLGAPTVKVATPDAGASQVKYLEALGLLRRYDDPLSVDQSIKILEGLESSASVQAALAKAYLTRFQLTREPRWARDASHAAQQAFAKDFQNPDVHVTLGEVHRLTGRPDDAIAEFQRALAEQPNNADAILGLAVTWKDKGDFAQAEKAYKQAIDLQPQFWGGYNKLGVFYFSQGKLAEAAKMFERVVELVPDNLRGYNNLGAVYQQMGRYDDAIRVFSSSIARKPTADAYSNLGTCFYFQGRFRDAATAFERATQMSANDHLLWANLGDAYRFIPNATAQAKVAFEKAIRLAETELTVNPQNAVAHATIATCAAKLGDMARADASIKKALDLEPTNGNFQFRAAVIANVARDQNAALKWLGESLRNGYSAKEIELDPEFANLRTSPAFRQLLRSSTTIR